MDTRTEQRIQYFLNKAKLELWDEVALIAPSNSITEFPLSLLTIERLNTLALVSYTPMFEDAVLQDNYEESYLPTSSLGYNLFSAGLISSEKNVRTSVTQDNINIRGIKIGDSTRWIISTEADINIKFDENAALREYAIHSEGLSDLIKALPQMPALKKLYIFGCALSSLPKDIDKLNQIEVLALQRRFVLLRRFESYYDISREALKFPS